MKTRLTIQSKRQFYMANVIGLIIVIALVIWLVVLSIDENGLDLGSLLFWLAVVLLMFVPFALISIFSAMSSVVITDKGLNISYRFKGHKSEVNFSDVKEFKSNTDMQGPESVRAGLRDSFQLILMDGRVFEFSRSQFENYDKLRAIVYKAVEGDQFAV